MSAGPSAADARAAMKNQAQTKNGSASHTAFEEPRGGEFTVYASGAP